ncbi:hypothetical protein FGB62_62g013 [Gracilaria domingensis]|nr:hypothetical protein FGB62_62g013 [Gracilaria domingensis]
MLPGGDDNDDTLQFNAFRARNSHRRQESGRMSDKSEVTAPKASITIEPVSAKLAVAKEPSFAIAPDDVVDLPPATAAAFQALGMEMRRHGYLGLWRLGDVALSARFCQVRQVVSTILQEGARSLNGRVAAEPNRGVEVGLVELSDSEDSEEVDALNADVLQPAGGPCRRLTSRETAPRRALDEQSAARQVGRSGLGDNVAEEDARTTL